MISAYCGLLLTEQGIDTIRAFRLSSTPSMIIEGFIWLVTIAALWFTTALYINHQISLNESRIDRDRLPFVLRASFIVPSLYFWVSLFAIHVADPYSSAPQGIWLWVFFAAYCVSSVWGALQLIKRLPIPLLDEESVRSDIWRINGPLIVIVFLITFGGNLLGYSLELPVAALLAAWLSFLIAIIISLDRFGRSIQFSGIAMVVLFPIGFSLADLNDNHELPFRRTTNTASNAGRAFSDWLEVHKTDVVFLVAAEGGGARAAYMTATVLEELRIRCPPFQHGFFAGIGVSGGSLGLALAAAGARDQAPRAAGDCSPLPDPPTFAAESSPAVKAAGADLLRTVMRGFLFADLPMRFLPGSLGRTEGRAAGTTLHRNWLMRMTDRAQYLEWRLDLVWVEAKTGARKGDLRDRSFAEIWRGGNGDVPALVLLATDAASGRRIAASHLRIGAPSEIKAPDCHPPDQQPDPQHRSRLLTYDEVAPGRDPTLIGAALVSARFPYITPPATLPCTKSKWRLVDGGYFENSGLTTALEIADELVASAKEQRREIRIVLVQLENHDASPADEGPSTSLVELLTPFRASLATRDARADQARDAVERRLGRNCEQGGGVCASFERVSLKLARCNVAIPLGWSISEGAQNEIQTQLGLRVPETQSGEAKCVNDLADHNRKSINHLMAIAQGKIR
jgi:hypothetical protein